MPNSYVSRTAPEAQPESSWAPPTGTLGELVAAAQARVGRVLSGFASELANAAADTAAPASLAGALRGTEVAVLAEVKRRSPSRGELNPALDAGHAAALYAASGAAAISVLTEPSRFGGSMADLRRVADTVAVPVLRKDFIVDELQLMEAKCGGASAVLLIARALSPDALASLAAAARALDLGTLIEVRDEAELARALACGADVVGVNARDLETLEVDPAVPHGLIPRIPPEVVAVAESGIGGRADVEALALAGANAVLVGSLLSTAPDPGAALRGLRGVTLAGRARVHSS